MFGKIFDFPSKLKVALALAWDSFSIVFALLFAFWIRLGVGNWHFSVVELSILFCTAAVTIGLFAVFGLYYQMIRYINSKTLYKIFTIIVFSVVVLIAGKYVFNFLLPATVPVIYIAVASVMVSAPRLLIQATSNSQSYKLREKCIIFGATEAGRGLATALREHGTELLPIAFVDDKSIYHGKEMLGIPVYSRAEIPQLKQKYDVTKMLLAVNNTSNTRRKELIAELEPYAIELLSIPNFADIVSGKSKIDELKEIKIEELLGRDPVPPIQSLLDVNIRKKVVMVTGAGGSIGSELCRQIVKSAPSALILFELSEFNLYQIENELSKTHGHIVVVPVLASIQDIEVLRNTIEKYQVQTIYHAAAYKHVPMVESNVTAGIRNNVFGTSNVALIAAEYSVEKFVLVSTDKAVRPTNIMGATKRFAELFVQGIAELHSDTEFAIVRFGNVLGSSGSVVPLFTEQIRAGGPVTVTHPDIIRYFMTIPEAAALVIQAGSMGKQGEVFVLDMGEPVKIVDLAQKMAHLMGHELFTSEQQSGDIKLLFSGLRPGEKLYEELLIDDAETDTEHPRIMGANEVRIEFSEVVMLLDRLNYSLSNRDEKQAIDILVEAPLAYSPSVR
jgi:FlaA1/EpsC-like NDP-sugar epimerase